MSLVSQLESILFVAGKPLSPSELAKLTSSTVPEVASALDEIKARLNQPESGVQLVDTGSAVQMLANPENSALVEKFTTEEIAGELTRAQLETLTVVAYQGPITRPELEAIRGVNCAIILRNLELRGLVEAEDDAEKLMPVYRLTVGALAHLGLKSASELPDYAVLHEHPYIAGALEADKENEA